MEKVNFGYVGENEYTIFKQCFVSFFQTKLKRSRSKAQSNQSPLLSKKARQKLEEVFMYLVNQGYENGYDVCSILQIPCVTGSTCFSDAAACSERITCFFLENNIPVNSIDTVMALPAFRYSDVIAKMIDKNINPRIVRYDGKCPINIYLGILEQNQSA